MINERWPLFQNWLQLGVAVCNDNVDHVMLASHPKKQAWRQIAKRKGLHFQLHYGYANTGFVMIVDLTYD